MKEINNERKLLIALREGTIPSERSGEYWNKEEKESLQRMFWNGDGISDIALSLQRSENAIIQQLIILKMLTPPGAAREKLSGREKVPSRQQELLEILWRLLQCWKTGMIF